MSAAADVTVVMVTRDGRSKGYFDAAVRSVLEQTAPPAEMIVVDDGSVDGTAQYTRRTYPAVRVVANAGTGLAAGRNTGIAFARRRWITFIDDDDRWRPEKLARQLAQIAGSERPESTIWASRMVAIDAGGRIASPPVRLDHLARWPACLLGCPITPSGIMVARTLLDRFGGFSEHLSEGSAFDFCARCLEGGATIAFSDEVLIEHRRHSRQMTRRDRTLATTLASDAIVLPHLERLPAWQADRLRTARALLYWRWFFTHAGPRHAAGYWRATPLRPARLNWRGTLFPLLDTAAARLPQPLQVRLRRLATRSVS